MKQIIYILTFLLLASCGQKKTKQSIMPASDTTTTNNNATDQQSLTEEENSEEHYRKQSLSGFEKATLYKLTDTIIADFNGDGFLDKAIYKKENETSGIIIIHGNTNDQVKIGFGKPFSIWTDDFDCNWVDYWELVEDSETSETTFDEYGYVLGSRDVKLQNPSIVLGKIDVGGGLISFINGEYVWIHQTC